MKQSMKVLRAVVLMIVLGGITYVTLQKLQWIPAEETHSLSTNSQVADSIAADTLHRAPRLLYGMDVDSLDVYEGMVKPNQNLSEILSDFNVSMQSIYQIAKQAKSVFDVRSIKAHKKYTVLYAKDSLKSARAFVYEPSPLEYVVFHLEDSIDVVTHKRKIEKVKKSITGVIHSSLYEDMTDQGASAELVDLVADMYGWQIDFTHLYPGDKYKVIYYEDQVEGQPVGVSGIEGAQFLHQGNDFFAIAYDQGKGTDYFDTDGKSLRKAFLRYPVKFTRISSRYSLHRYHPVQHRWKAHLGTDYAAPVGTPIRAAGDGIITRAKYQKYNGNNVKIRHNAEYTTQYLHMNHIAKGIHPGVKVKQGQIIGYVGQTGLATGPHLCYRFWKNGKQVDALKVDLPAADPIQKDNLAEFYQTRDKVLQELKAISFPDEDVLMASAQ